MRSDRALSQSTGTKAARANLEIVAVEFDKQHDQTEFRIDDVRDKLPLPPIVFDNS
jgi:hypothetical protein